MIDTAMMVTRPRRTAWNRGGDGRLELARLRVPGRTGFGMWEGGGEVAATSK
jgi:hypothetical protein